MRAVLNLPLDGGSDVDPVDGDDAGGVFGGSDVARGNTGGDVVEQEVVEVGSPGGPVGLDGHKVTVAGVACQGDSQFSPGVSCKGDGVDTHERSDVVGIGHDTHLEYRAVG